jgi:hypothetical protein
MSMPQQRIKLMVQKNTESLTGASKEVDPEVDTEKAEYMFHGKIIT